MPGSMIGNHTVVFTAFLHYSIGVTILKIVGLFQVLFYFTLTAGGLVQLWRRLAVPFHPWYEQIADSARKSSVLHAEETGCQ
jgi:hypothetical protein